MTKELERAIRHIKNRADAWAIKEVTDALKKEPCEKCVYSTKDGYCQYDDITETIPPLEPTSEMVHVETLRQVMWERDIAIEQLHELGYELGQKIDSCDNAVSREIILSKIKEVCFSKEWTQFRVDNGSHGQRDYLINFIEKLPPVTPTCEEREKGECPYYAG